MPCDAAIPNILYFTYKLNLLNSAVLRGDDVALAGNVHKTIRLVPNMTVRFLTDSDCLEEIDALPHRLRNAVRPRFVRESRGMIRAYFQAIMAVKDARDPTIGQYLRSFAAHEPRSAHENTGTILLRAAVHHARTQVYELTERRGPLVIGGKRTRSTHLGYWCDNVVSDDHTQEIWFYSRSVGSRMCRPIEQNL